MMGMLDDFVLEEIAASMDLKLEEVKQIVTRAYEDWAIIKRTKLQ